MMSLCEHIYAQRLASVQCICNQSMTTIQEGRKTYWNRFNGRFDYSATGRFFWHISDAAVLVPSWEDMIRAVNLGSREYHLKPKKKKKSYR
jgi:hypothetical protein